MASSGHLPGTSDLRIILIGPCDVDLASTGNTILGRRLFESQKRSKCMKVEGKIAGRRITLVTTPNRWSSLPLIDTTERDKQEIMLSMLLCNPGPHAILLVIGEEMTTQMVESIEEHTELLGNDVWDHTILIFPHDRQFEKSAGKAFTELVRKCGDRSHVLSNQLSDDIQVTELLKKIDMLQENKGQHYPIDRKIYLVQKWRKDDDKRAEQRRLRTQNQRELLRAKMGGTSHVSDIRILLTGYQYSGKSSTGNTILAGELFPLKKITKHEKRHGVVQGRHVTIVDTPGLWRIHKVKFTPELHKQDIVLSAAACSPGPHILLVHVRLDTSFTKNNRRAMKGHLQLLGENVWRYTIVLFTCGETLEETTIEQFIESEGEALQWLVEKCNNRYHVFNNRREDRAQVFELLEKIDEVVASNDGGHFEIDQMILQEVQKRRKVVEDKAKIRRQAGEEQESEQGASSSDSKLNIVLIGWEKAGKTKVGNMILGKNIFSKQKTFKSAWGPGRVAGREVVVVDTPGWDPNDVLSRTPKLDWQIVQSVQTLCSNAESIVFLLVVRAARSFKEVNKRTTEEYMQLLGEHVWNHTIVLFTAGGLVEDMDIEQHIESEGDALQWLVEKCGNRYHFLNISGKKGGVEVPELMSTIEQVAANNKACPFELDKDICQTAERKFSSEKSPTSQRTLSNSMPWLPHNMSDDDLSIGYASSFDVSDSDCHSHNESDKTEEGPAQSIHFSTSKSLGDLIHDQKQALDTTSLKTIAKQVEQMALGTVLRK